MVCYYNIFNSVIYCYCTCFVQLMSHYLLLYFYKDVVLIGQLLQKAETEEMSASWFSRNSLIMKAVEFFKSRNNFTLFGTN